MSEVYERLALPESVVSKTDLSRLVSELEQVDNEVTAVVIRAKQGVKATVPTLSENLNAFLILNKLNLSDERVRTELIKQMHILKDKVPVVHMTFAVPADGESLQQLAKWVREEIHPQALISIGLQPSLIAGVYLRTPNHVHDLSLRATLNEHHGALVKTLGALRG